MDLPDRFAAPGKQGEIPSLMGAIEPRSPCRSLVLPSLLPTQIPAVTVVQVLSKQPTSSEIPNLPRRAALDLAETADFETEEIQNYLAKKRLERMLASSNSLQKLGFLTADLPQLRQETPTSPPQ